MRDFVATLSGVAPADVETFQRERDKNLNPVYGYSAARFPRSFEDTILNFLAGASADQVRHVRALAEAVFRQKAEIMDDAELVLRSLHHAGFHLGLLTAGEAWVQQKRIAEFHLQGVFHAIDVVEDKTAAAFSRFCKKHAVDPGACWVVGDSLKSDIVPAIAAGLNAIHVPHENWSPVEGAAQVDKSAYTEVASLKDLLGVLNVQPFEFCPQFKSEITCYGIFEGGGARGLAHVGALRACEERKVRFAGVAGTSAGSIIAGLIAVGYRADELFRLDGQDSQSGELDRNYITLLGQQEWYRAINSIAGIERAAKKLNASPSRGRLQRLPALGSVYRLARKIRSAYHWGKLGLAAVPLRRLSNDLGYFSTTAFEDWYNTLLARKLGKPDNYRVTFSDIDFDLQIISADLNNSALVVHSKEKFSNRSVAEAVVASISIPIVFRPKAVDSSGGSELHVDGGMLSNFPAWVFSGSHDWPVLGFELVNRHEMMPRKPDLFEFLRALLATAISGKRRLEVRGIQNMHVVTIPVSIGAFQFEPSPSDRRLTYSEGFDAAQRFFPQTRQLVTQEQMAPFLYKAYRMMLDGVGRGVHLRINVMDRNSLNRLAIRYHYNMDFDPDDRMELSLDAGGAGQCFAERAPILVDLYRARREFSSFRMSKYEQALVRSSLKTLLSVPIFDMRADGDLSERPLIGVLNFDSDDLSSDEMLRLEETAMDASAMISYAWIEIAEHGEVRKEP